MNRVGPMVAGWQSLSDAWERQQNAYRPDREAGMRALVAAATRLGATSGDTIVDLACGGGSVTSRLVTADPAVNVVGVDRDPVLLRLASDMLGASKRVHLVRADFDDANWLSVIDDRRVRSFTAAASLHWLSERTLKRLYRDLAALLPQGGGFFNLDWFRLDDAPTIQAYLDDVQLGHETSQLQRDGVPSWREWWSMARARPELREAFAERDRLLLKRSEEFMATQGWHEAQLRTAGFREVGLVWRSLNSAVLVGVK